MTKKMTIYDTTLDKTIESNLEEINNLENYIGQILDNTNFDCLNFEKERECNNLNRRRISEIEDNAEFISINLDSLAPYAQLITEKEFFKIVEGNTERIYKTSGKYQEFLYSNYIEAKREQDEGYIKDVLSRAVILKNNMNYAKKLAKNARFMREWRNNFVEKTPLEEIKNSGSLRKINIVKARID